MVSKSLWSIRLTTQPLPDTVNSSNEWARYFQEDTIQTSDDLLKLTTSWQQFIHHQQPLFDGNHIRDGPIALARPSP